MSVPEVHYARSGDVAIAYQVVGEGPLDLVFIRGTLADLLAAWDQPLLVDHVEGLASFARVILFDKRGSGLSDPVNELPTLEARMDDVRAVFDAPRVRACSAVGGAGRKLGSRSLFAATYPERIDSLVLYDPSARGLWAPDYPWATDEDAWAAELREAGELAGVTALSLRPARRYVPSKADDVALHRLVRLLHAPERKPSRSSGLPSHG